MMTRMARSVSCGEVLRIVVRLISIDVVNLQLLLHDSPAAETATEWRTVVGEEDRSHPATL
jgi:hypothetical protein